MPTEYTESELRPNLWQHVTAYVIFLIYGLVYLGSWNTWITATAFFKTRFFGSAFADTFMSYFGITYMIIMFICLALFLAVPKILPLNTRIILGHGLVIVVFSVAAIMVWLTLNPYFYFFITLGLISLSSVATSLLAAVYGILPLYPPVFSSAFMSGQGLAGLIPSFLQLVLTSTNKDAEENSYRAFGYFFLSIGLAVLVMAGYQMVLPSLRVGVHPASEVNEVSVPNNETNVIIQPNGTEALVITDSVNTIVPKKGIYKGAFDRIWLLGFTLWLGFVITLAAFPAITSAVASENKDRTLIVSIHFVIFNIFDLLGKTMPGFPCLFIKSPIVLFGVSVARLLFLPAFLFCNVTFYDRFGNVLDRTLPLLFDKNWMFYIILALFALTNGYLDANLIILAPALI